MNQNFSGSSTFSNLAEVNTVLKNTYFMLSLTLIFSALTAALSMYFNTQMTMGLMILSIVIMIGFPFLLGRIQNSHWAIPATFAYTGFIGWTLGPILNVYIKTYANGPSLIMLALGSTGLIFLLLSALALNPKRNFTGIGSFLMIGMIMAFVASLVNMFFLHLPVLQLAISVIFALISAGYILYTTNSIVHGGCNNYVIATVMLYVSLVNIFLTLLQLFGMFGGNRNN